MLERESPVELIQKRSWYNLNTAGEYTADEEVAEIVTAVEGENESSGLGKGYKNRVWSHKHVKTNLIFHSFWKLN